jgi:hypothetical protein
MPVLYPIVCPHCRKPGKGPIELEGKYIRCRACKKSFQVKLPAQAKAQAKASGPEGPGIYAFAEGNARDKFEEAPIPVLPVLDEEEESSNPYGVTDMDERRRCPYCADLMEEEDVICLNCGYNTQTRMHIRIERTYANTTGDVFMWLLPGIICVISIFVVIGFDLFWWFGLENLWWKPMDDFLGLTSISLGIRVWEVVISLFVIWFLAKFAFKRLILNPTPPEVQKEHIKQNL